MKPILLSFAVFALFAAPAVLHADTLAELVSSSDTGWMIGNWATEDGAATLTYTWKLDKHAIGVGFTMGERESEGMIVRKPGSEDLVVYAAADNAGGTTSGKWTDFDGKPTLISKTTTIDGTVHQLAIGHNKSDDDTMIVTIYAIGDDEKPDAAQGREVTFKRKK